MRPYLLFSLLLTAIAARSQTLTITVDATHRRIKDTLLIGDHRLAVHPGKTTTSTLPIQSPTEMLLDGYFFVGANDSIHLSYDAQQEKYTIDGGRYPDNYHAYADLISPAIFPDLVTHRIEYEEYVLDADTSLTSRFARIKEEAARGTLSPDVAEYLMAYLKYKELAGLLNFQFSRDMKLLPSTGSRLYPVVTLEDLRQDRYARIWPYIDCAIMYLRNQFKSKQADTSATQAINFALDSLDGETRARVLYSLIVSADYKLKTAVYARVRSLHLAHIYAKGIDRQYEKSIREHQPLNAALLNQPLLRTPAGRSISLRSILDTLQDKDVFIKFAEYGLNVSWGGSLDIEPVVTNPRIVTIDVYTSFQAWQRATKDRILTNEFYLPNGLKNPLMTALFINNLPTWIALSKTGAIDDIDISIDDMFRYNLVGN